MEVRAKLGKGDWLLNRVRLLPEGSGDAPGNGVYGAWPMSGEIDLLGARTNNAEYEGQGSNFILSSLQYGPFAGTESNRVIQAPLLTKLDGWVEVKRGGFDKDFHTYTLEWTPKFMRFYVDSRLQSSLFLQTKGDKQGFFHRAHYPITHLNSSTGTQEVVANPWAQSGPSAPFDQKFYVAIDLGVGGTAGWFRDGVGGKPWVDGSQTAMSDFVQAQDSWTSTWPQNVDDKAFRIDYVKMWEVC